MKNDLFDWDDFKPYFIASLVLILFVVLAFFIGQGEGYVP